MFCLRISQQEAWNHAASTNQLWEESHTFILCFLSFPFHFRPDAGRVKLAWEICGRFNLSCTRCATHCSFECVLSACAPPTTSNRSLFFFLFEHKKGYAFQRAEWISTLVLSPGNSSCRWAVRGHSSESEVVRGRLGLTAFFPWLGNCSWRKHWD